MNNNFNVSEFIRNLDLNCSKVQKKNFHKGEVITNYITKRNQLCILLSGEADLVRYDFNGNKTIVEHFLVMISLEKFFILLLQITNYL